MTSPNPEQPSGRFRWTGFQGKTLWDFLGLLIVPLVLTLVAFAFSQYQAGYQATIEENRAKDNILQSYLDDMTTLMLREEFSEVSSGTCPRSEEEEQPREEEDQPPIETLARSRSLVVRNQLDGERLGAVVRFLGESKSLSLIDCDLNRVNLPRMKFLGLNLSGASLVNANLYGADLTEADLTEADLSGTDLTKADLIMADLTGATLSGATLLNANLIMADLSGAYLGSADLTEASLYEADLTGTDLTEADLTEADLTGATLIMANLYEADLTGTDLTWATLSEADLTGADLSEATFNTESTLPDGTMWTRGTDMERFTNPENPNFWDVCTEIERPPWHCDSADE